MRQSAPLRARLCHCGYAQQAVTDSWTLVYDESVEKLVRIMWIPVLLTALYTGWVLWQRHQSQAPPPAPVMRDPLAKYGGKVKIVQFYSGSSTIAPDGKALICYGVVNANQVRLKPPVEKVWPALSRCFDVAPSHTTRYTLTAEGMDHKVATASLEIVVR